VQLFIVALSLLGLSVSSAAQIDYAMVTAQRPLPDYDISYEAPTVEQILSACDRSGWRAIIFTGALDDCGSIGSALIKTCRFHPDGRYRALIDTAAEYISHIRFRLKDGLLARHRPQPESQWSDDLYGPVRSTARIFTC
jgi:rhamnogalacturonyl hydrolase YesR